ncbi:MAG: NAD-dependent epimerase/dehydratase family protein [Deltaproteobacteria bacterium]|nr:NAD-dependent epimerase/dehydratase family protein [Deltaproteobacteria bacterium]
MLVTGAAGGLGRLVCRMLHRDFEVIAVDRRPFPDRPKDVTHLRVDIRRKSAQKEVRKHKPDAIVHLGVMHNPHKKGGAFHFNLEGTTQLLRMAEKLEVRKLIFLSTANLYGPSATTSGFMTEEAPLLAGGRSPEIRDLISLDMMIQSFFWKRPETETVILRPVHIIGAHLKNAPSIYLSKDTIPTLMGFDPMLQLIHESDVVRAISKALQPGSRGVFNITGGTGAPLSRVIQARNKKQLPMPGPLFKRFLRRAFSYRLTNFPPSEIVHLKYSCLVDDDRAKKELGFQAETSLSNALIDLG